MTLELVPWRGANVPVLARDEISRYNIQDYLNWIQYSQNYMGTPAPVTTYGNRPAEPISSSFEGFVWGMLYAAGPVAAVEAYRLRVFGQAPLLYQDFVDGRGGDFFDDPVLERLREPWTSGNLSDLMKRSLVYGDFGGNAFVLDLEDELVLVRPDWVEIVLEKRMHRGGQVGWRQRGIVYYEGGLNVGDGVPFLPGEYCHFVPGLPDPLATYRGMSWLTPLVREVQADKAASDHKVAFFENAASPNLAVSLPKELTTKQFNDFVEAMDAKHKGVQNVGKTLYTGGGADVTVIGANMQQMDFSSVQGKGETRVANAGGVPPTLLSFSEGMQGSSLNAGNYTAAKRNFVDTTMRDLWQNFASSIQKMDAFRPPKEKSRLWYVGRDIPFMHEDAKDLAEIQQTQASTVSSYITAGFKPDTAVTAVERDDLKLLEHTGLTSVQLMPPGSQDTDGDGVADAEAQAGEDYEAALDEFRSELAEWEDEISRAIDAGELDEDEIERRDYYDVRDFRGRFRKISDRVGHALNEWLKGDGEADDPLEEFSRENLRLAAKEFGITPRRGASSDELKLALLKDARARFRGESNADAKPSHRLTLSSPTYRDQDVGVYHDGGKVSLYRESSSGQRGSKVVTVASLAELEQWGRDNGEPQVAEWAASERGVPVKKAVPRKAPAKKAAPKKAVGTPVEGAAVLGATDVPMRSLSSDEVRSLGGYGLESHHAINGGLRSGSGSTADLRPKHQGMVADIDGIMARSPLAEDVVVYRGLGGRDLTGNGFPIDLDLTDPSVDWTGQTWTDHGYSSTSVTRDGAKAKTSRIMLRLRVPAGTPAISNGDLDPGEVLLGRGLTFRVVSDGGIRDGQRQLEVEVVASAPPAKAAPRKAAKSAPASPEAKSVRDALAEVGVWIDPDMAEALKGADPDNPADLRQRAARLRSTAATEENLAGMRLGNNPAGSAQAQKGEENLATARRYQSAADVLDAMAGPDTSSVQIHGRDLEQLIDESGLRGKTPTQIKRIASENNVDIPTAVKTATARQRVLIEALMDFEGRRGGGDPDRAIGRIRQTSERLYPSVPAKATRPKREPLGDPEAKIASLRALGDVEAVRDDLDLHTLPELKTLASSLGVATSGRKRDVVDRITAKIDAGRAKAPDAAKPVGSLEDRVAAATPDILAAYRRLTRSPGGYVKLADLRRELPGHDRDAVDEALRRYNRQPGINIIGETGAARTSADDEAAVTIGGQPAHVISFEDVKPTVREVSEPDVRAAAVSVIDAYRRARRPGSNGWVKMVDLRRELGDHDRDAVDEALKRIGRVPGADVISEVNQKTLTPDDRAAAVFIGGRRKDLINIEDDVDLSSVTGDREQSARDRQASLDAARTAAEALVDLDTMAHNGGSEKALRQRVDTRVRMGALTEDEGARLREAIGGTASGEPFDARVARARKGRAATSAVPYKFTGVSTANSDLFPDKAEREAIRDALLSYKGIGSRRVNQRLRGGDSTTDGRVAQVDRAFARSALASDVVVYRGWGGQQFGPQEDWPDDLTGVEFTDRAYFSTSPDRSKAEPFANPSAGTGSTRPAVMARILAPAGTPALALRSAHRIETPEAEILLDRDLRYRVVADHGPDERGVRQIDLEVVPAAVEPDPAGFRTAVADILSSRNTTTHHSVGDTVPFDPSTMRHQGDRPAAGTPVQVVSPGASMVDDGGVVTLAPTVVMDAGGAGPKGDASSPRVDALRTRIAELGDEARPIAEEIAKRLESTRVHTHDEEQAYYRRLDRLRELNAEGATVARDLLRVLTERDGEPWGGDPDADADRWQPVALGFGTFENQHTLDPDEIQKLRDRYVITDSTTIRNNASLRSGSPTPAAESWARRMSRMVRSSRLAHDARLYRGAALTPEQIVALRPGTVIRDRGIVSTDERPDGPGGADFYANTRVERNPGTIKTLFEIRAPQGSAAISVGHSEVVLDRDQNFRVVSSRQDADGTVHVVMELIP